MACSISGCLGLSVILPVYNPTLGNAQEGSAENNCAGKFPSVNDGFGKTVKEARLARGWSQERLAADVGTTQSTIERIENGGSLRSRFRLEVASILGIPLPGTRSALVDSPMPGFYRPPPQFLGARDLPVFSAVEGGPGEMVVSTDAIQYVQRPWFLEHVRDGYAVIVTGESMIPVYEPGDMVLINPKLPALRGKNAIFVGGEEHGEFRATVKRLERSAAHEWIVKQWNEPREFSLQKREWPRALRIVGKYEAQ